MRRALAAVRHWFYWAFIAAIPLTVLVPIPAWALFAPLVVALLIRAPRVEDAAPREVRCPVDGRWVAINSPANRVPSHGVRTLGQAYAIDVLHPTDDSTPAPGWGIRQRRPEEYSCFGAPVRAVADGTVFAVLDRMRDHRARNTWFGLIHMLVVEAIVRELGGPQFIIGNHVVIDHGDGAYSLYAHLQRGSASVAVGDRVAAGAQVGCVGNTGNTSEPHLHFQLMDRRVPAASAGLPFRWAEIDLESVPDARWAPDGLPADAVPGLPATGQRFTAPRLTSHAAAPSVQPST